VAAIDERGSAELQRLTEVLETPCQLGAYTLEGLICRTSTALVFVARGGVFGAGEGVMKLTGKAYAPLLDRELRLLNWCQESEVSGIVRPVRAELEWLGTDAAAILLPFLDGGDLVQWIGAQATTRSGRLGPHLALEVGEHVGGVLRHLLELPRPLVHRDVKLQNVLLAYPGAPLSDLTLIDLDVSEELDISHKEFASAPPAVAESLVGDVRGFGELLFDLATGHDPPTQGVPNPNTGNAAFDVLVEKCLTSMADGPGYVSLADAELWRDLDAALALERARTHPDGRTRPEPPRYVPGGGRRYLAMVGALLFIGLLLAVASKVFLE
jgi:serine/threonine protein kinase